MSKNDIWDTCVEGLTRRFSEYFDNLPDTAVVNVGSRTDLRAVVKKYGSSKKLPFFALQMGSVALNREGYNVGAFKRHGMAATRYNRENAGNNIPDRTLVFKFIPVKIRTTVRFITNDIKHVNDFAKQWMKHCAEHTLNFDIELGESVINIKIEPDEEISYPDLELEDMGTFWTMEVGLVMSGYTGEVVKVPTIKRFNMEAVTILQTTEDEAALDREKLIESNLKNTAQEVV